MDIPAQVSSTDPYFDLGVFERKVSTESSHAQTWFNRGLVWTYAFNHEEACICFKQVIAHDPDCAMGYWGLAFASGPNYNKSWAVFGEEGLRAIVPQCRRTARLAVEKSSKSSPVEAALIRALPERYPTTHTPDDLTESNKAYADAMRDVYQEFGRSDLDVTTLFADALMTWKPRRFFDKQSGIPIHSSPVFEVKEVLESGLKHPDSTSHPGVAHLYIHLMEMSATPEASLAAADIIRELVPEGGHMCHMPTHIDVLVGEYRRAITYNYKATLADDKFFALRGGLNFYSFYRLHDYHSLIYAAMLAGQSKIAVDSVDRMEATITEEMLRVKSPPMADWMEFFMAVRPHVLIRFGMWDELLALKLPDDQELYCVTTAMILYGKAVAHAARNELEEADKGRRVFIEARNRVPESRLDFPNRMVDVLSIATSMLDGEIEYRRKNYDIAFNHLREAISAEDRLEYAEPWAWMVPARHPYGALSLEQGLVEQAAIAYAQDLGLEDELTRAHQHPKNVWALHGYHECLVRLGRPKEALIIQRQLTLAQAEADVPVGSSCFCRLGSKACCRPNADRSDVK